MSNLVPYETYSVKDYRRWEGDWELIRGVPLAMAPSGGAEHQRVARRLLRQLDEALAHCPQCEVFHEIDVELAADTLVRPDVIIVCTPPVDDRIVCAPALIAEVVSPRTARRDEQTKFQLYGEEGVGHYLLLYPDQAKVKVYRLIDGQYRKLGDLHHERLVIELPDCRIALDCSKLWGC